MPRNTSCWVDSPKTFRRGSRQLWGKWGGNLQNIEKSMRSIYIPDGFNPYDEKLKAKCKYWLQTGDSSIFTEEELMTVNVFIQADQSGAEALAVAYLCKDADYRQLFIHNVKPHVYVALKLFKEVWNKKLVESGSPEIDIDLIDVTPIGKLKLNPDWKSLDSIIKDSDNWPLSERYYYFAKQTCHSANYGIKENTFVLNVLEKSGGKVNIPKEEGRRFLEIYRGLFPEIPEWNDFIISAVDKHKVLYNLLGHPYQITDYNISNYKDYIAWIPQSTIGEITRTAFCDLQEYIEVENKKWDILLDGHDAILTQGRLFDVKERINKMQEFINIEMISPVDGAKFRMRSEARVGFNWSDYKKEINELGLRELKW